MKQFLFDMLTSDRSMVTAGTAAVTTPFWFPSVDHLSSLAATWLPIIGVLWLLIQMGFFVYGKIK